MLFNVFCKVITFKYTQEECIAKIQTFYKVFSMVFNGLRFSMVS